tara:strand:+ start:1671 stop:2294 length:624 start_codon:yes stop_codon:yes gene_type:complete
MRYEEITEFRSRNETQIFRALLQQYSRPLSDSLAEYNKAIQLAKINTPALTTVNVVRDPMFQSMARTMFRMGIGKKDAGKFLSRDEPADQLRLIKSFSEKNWLQVLRTKGGISGIKTVNPDVQAGAPFQFKTPENLKAELQSAPPNVFGADIENMIKTEADVFKFYALVDYFEIVLTTMNVKDAAGRFTPDNIKKGFTDFERTVTGQ